MKKSTLLVFVSFFLICHIQSQNIRLGFYAPEKPSKSAYAITSTFEFVSECDYLKSSHLKPKTLKSLKQLSKFDVIWLHIADSSIDLATAFNEEAISNLKTFVEEGGGLLLSREAFAMVNLLGLEDQKPELVHKKATDNGYGRMLGFHAFREHPVFDGLNGGAYVIKPSGDIRVRNFGYPQNHIPQGQVVATDWDYIFLRENNKLILEYTRGKGKVLAVGAYMYFELPSKSNAQPEKLYNVNRQHLEKFTANCLNYLAGNMTNLPVNHWNFTPPLFEAFDAESVAFPPSMQHQKPPHDWQTHPSAIALQKRLASKDYWDIAGERLLVMGKQTGGIDEVWAHPLMAFRDYEAGIRFSDTDSIFWLSDETPMVTAGPESFLRLYQFKDAFLEELITVSPEHPQGVIHYEYSGVYPAAFFVRFKTNQRIMWPYSHQVLGGIKYDFHEGLNAFVMTDPSAHFTTILGFNKETQPVYLQGSPLLPAIKKVKNPIGRFDSFKLSDSIWSASPTTEYLISAMTKIQLEKNDNVDVIFGAGSEGIEKAFSGYDQARRNPEKIYQKATAYQEKISHDFLQITTPDSIFNLAYQWAIAGSDRFFVHTPGMGKSIVAGYGTTANGWNGEHEINGRPGYSWYFGRDAVWSAFAFLQYGDFEKVKSILELLQDYQDLNGKIFHELSTSGFAHYDASDATPLYVILAGRYLQHSGDTAFIRESLPHLKAAMDFMYSTDTDHDGLIENTNVGHGWVEGGELFGSHTSLYLAACWAEALEQAGLLFLNMDYAVAANKYLADHRKVVELINDKYWNGSEGYYYHGLRQDQSFIDTQSIMPAIPILFGDADEEKAKKVARKFGGNAYTADWGARIISQDSPSFNPKGYHTGSVWPLYTGWVALAEYKAGRTQQGFSHIMNNMLIYDDWALGYLEEVLHGTEYKPAGVCHHQCWSQTMALQPTLEGMLGMFPEATKNKLTLSPAFPAHWDTVVVTNIKTGNHNISFEQKRDGERITYTFENKSDEPINLDFRPQLPKGTHLITKSLNGKLQRPGKENRPEFLFELRNMATIELTVEGGIEVLPVYINPKPGLKSDGFRFIDDKLNDRIYQIRFEGKPESHETFSVYIQGKPPVKVDKAEMIRRIGNVYTFEVKFPKSSSTYVEQVVRIYRD